MIMLDTTTSHIWSRKEKYKTTKNQWCLAFTSEWQDCCAMEWCWSINRFLGSIARNYNAFPISYSSWRKIPKDYKENMLKNTIQVSNV